MNNKYLFIDRTSVGWEHKDFNKYYIEEYSLKNEGSFYICMNEDIDFSIVSCRENLIKKGLLKLIFFILKNKPRVVFLCMTKKDYWLALFTCVFTDVSFIVHKYNLNANKYSLVHRMLYKIIVFMGVKPMFQDEPVSECFSGTIDNINPFRGFVNSGVVYDSKDYVVKRIIFVGNGTEDKAPEKAKAYAQAKGYSFLQLCDISIKTIKIDTMVLPFNKYSFEYGDVVWGCYKRKEYNGVQSGLPFFSLQHNVPILVESTSSFLRFSCSHGNYLIMKG